MKRTAEASPDSSKIKEKRNKLNKKCAKVLDIEAYFESASEADIITKLQDNIIDLNMIDKKNITLFMYSANKGYCVLFTYLNSNPNVKKGILTKEKETIIHCAARGGNKDILYALLEKSTNIDTKAINGNTPLHLAAYYGHIEVVKILLADFRVNPAADDNDAIREAAFMGHTEVVKLLLADPRVNPRADNSYAIRWSAYNGHLEVVRLLLADSRVNPAADDNYAIRMAAYNGHLEVVKLLIKNKAVNSNMDYNALVKIALDNKNNNLYAILESYNPANKGFFTVWAGRKDLGSSISSVPEETIKEEIIQKIILIQKQLIAKTIA